MEKLDEILENTKEIKEVIVKKRKAQQDKQDIRKEQVKEAQKKFKQIKTNINEELQEQVNTRLEALGTNTSAYIQDLIKKDLDNSPKVENINYEEYIKNLTFWEFIKLKYM